MLIRPLDPAADLGRVAGLYARAADYWLLADRAAPDAAKARAFFTDAPPGCDPAASHRLGIFRRGRLAGVAELSFGFPDPRDAYLGLMLLAPRQRGQGLGAQFLTHIEALARAAGAPRILLAVLDENPRGRTFWEGNGFRDTAIWRDDPETGHRIRRLDKLL